MNSARGFTLVEVMVALVVLSLLMLGTLSALRTFGDTQTRIKATAQQTDQVRQVSQFLRNTLRQAVLQLAAHFFEHRTGDLVGVDFPPAVVALIETYRPVRLSGRVA